MNATAPANPADSDPQPRVPLDIQLAIVDACPDLRTRLMLISTHKTLRKRGARLVLQSPSAPVRIYSSAAARSFFVFCAAQGPPNEPSSPIAVLHTLNIAPAALNPTGTENLIILLANVPRLTSLSLYDPDETLRRCPSLYAALRRLRTLKTFQVQRAESVSFRLISEIASALETVDIVPSRLATRTVFLNLSVVLGPHKDTLVHVAILCTNILRGMDIIQPEDSRVVFEKVQRLVLPQCVSPGASRFIKAFPNAVSLRVGTGVTAAWKRTEFVDQIRTVNLSAVQGGHGNPSSLEPDCWPSLETVRGGLLDLYVFGNSCSVATLQIDGVIKSDWVCVAMVVQTHNPVILRLSVTASLQVDVWEREWRRLCSVKFLVLQFVVEEEGRLDSLTDMVRRAVGSFVHCKYVFLDFKAANAEGRSRLVCLNHIDLRSIVEDRQLGPFEIAIRSPTKTTYWCHRPYFGRKRESHWDSLYLPAETSFQTLHCFPKDHVTDDWV